MNNLDSFDENKKKCVSCQKYFNKEDFSTEKHALTGRTLVATACPSCEAKSWDEFCKKNKLNRHLRPYTPKKINNEQA
jgi:hypothetical protein